MSPSPDRFIQSSQPALPDETAPISEQPSAAHDATLGEASTTADRETAPEETAAHAHASADPPPLVPKRPLMRPVSRPQLPATPPTVQKSAQKPVEIIAALPKSEPAPPPTVESKPAETPEAVAGQALIRQQPIPPPSEPKQYRAIGLVRGRYTPTDEQFTRGAMLTSDGTEVEAVLLGRVMSLVRNHLDLEQQHLWVVYPRTREMRQDLHVQIVGVWEPEKLNKETEDESAEGVSAKGISAEAATIDQSEPETAPEPTAPAEVSASSTLEESGFDENYFSVRGEVVFYAADEQQIVVKIQQAPRKTADREKAFKLRLDGVLSSPKALGYFWDLQVERRGAALVVTSGTAIGLVPPKKKTASAGFKRTGDRRPPQRKARPTGTSPTGTRSAAPVGAPAQRREPLPKPVKRSESPGEG